MMNCLTAEMFGEWHEPAGNHLHFEYSGLYNSTHVEGDKPLDLLKFFIDDDAYELMVKHMNCNAAQVVNAGHYDESRLSSWKDVSRGEMEQ